MASDASRGPRLPLTRERLWWMALVATVCILAGALLSLDSPSGAAVVSLAIIGAGLLLRWSA